MKKKTENVFSMEFCGLLTIAFVVLKLCGKIDWSWVWVLCPLWIPIAIATGILLMLIGCGIIWELVKK